jgi:hypothetical protein
MPPPPLAPPLATLALAFIRMYHFNSLCDCLLGLCSLQGDNKLHECVVMSGGHLCIGHRHISGLSGEIVSEGEEEGS